MGTLTAGVARRIINPPLGVKTFGFSSREGGIQVIESDLTATALVLGDGEKKVAVIASDTGWLALETMNDLRRRVGDAIGAPPSHVMINLSHTHSAPSMPEWAPDEPEQTAMQAKYRDDLCGWIIAAAREADANAQPARIGAGWGACHIGVNRREKGPDGKVSLGENPAGPTDPAVGVIRVDDLDGNPIATLFSYGCHTVVVGPRALAASPDFPGAARKVVETTLGGTAMFLQACGGNIMPVGGMGYEVDCRDAKNRIGSMLGGEALKVVSGIRTHVERGPRTSLGSLSNITLWPWTPVTGDTCAYLDAADETVALDFIDLPSRDVAKRFQQEWREKRDDARSRSARDWEINVTSRFADWADRLVETVETDRRTLDVTVQALRVNDIALATMSVEAFCETGLTLKAQSPIPHTQALGYTNGCVCYLPRAEAYPPGGWDIHERYGVPDMLFQAYSLPVAIHPDSEQRVVDHTLALLDRLR